MTVPVVKIGEVRVFVRQWLVGVFVCMRLRCCNTESMRVLVMRVMHVAVTVRQRLVRVRMLVALREMQPQPERHECSSSEEQRRHRIAPE